MELKFNTTSFHLKPLISLENILLNLSWNTVEELVVCIEWGIFWSPNMKPIFSDNSPTVDTFLRLDSAIRGPNLPSLAKFSLVITVEYMWIGELEPQVSEFSNSLETQIRNKLPSISNSSKIQLDVRVC
jgi:hypothetical protein